MGIALVNCSMYWLAFTFSSFISKIYHPISVSNKINPRPMLPNFVPKRCTNFYFKRERCINFHAFLLCLHTNQWKLLVVYLTAFWAFKKRLCWWCICLFQRVLFPYHHRWKERGNTRHFSFSPFSFYLYIYFYSFSMYCTPWLHT